MFCSRMQFFIKLPHLLEFATPEPHGVLVHDQKRQIWLIKFKKTIYNQTSTMSS
jgi:hypothetical protein